MGCEREKGVRKRYLSEEMRLITSNTIEIEFHSKNVKDK